MRKDYLRQLVCAVYILGVVIIAFIVYGREMNKRANALEQELFVSTGNVEYLDNVAEHLVDDLYAEKESLYKCLNK